MCGKNVKVLWLPPAHCEFNAIELIWAYVKGYISKHNNGNKNVSDMRDLAIEALNTVTKELWQKCINHAIKFEQRMWERDQLLEDHIFEKTDVNILITDNDDSESSDSDDSDSDIE